jgi:serine acetyltransferase
MDRERPLVLKGVSVANGSIVGARAVVVHSVTEERVVPARVIRSEWSAPMSRGTESDRDPMVDRDPGLREASTGIAVVDSGRYSLSR